jgi:hypothetical protein
MLPRVVGDPGRPPIIVCSFTAFYGYRAPERIGNVGQILVAKSQLGSAGAFYTLWGLIEFTDRDIGLGIDGIVRDDGGLKATAERAARDLRRVGRNVGLIDNEILAEVTVEEPFDPTTESAACRIAFDRVDLESSPNAELTNDSGAAWARRFLFAIEGTPCPGH